MNFIIKKKLSPSDLLASRFLERAKEFNASVELIKVLKSRTYRIGESNVLIRAASDGNKRYFFGLNYITVEEMANLENPFVAFICGSTERIILLPAKTLFSYLPKISHDRNGEYKINIDKEFNIILNGRGNRFNCIEYVNNWEMLLSPPPIQEESKNSVEESFHTILQGRIIEIGNIRGYQTFCPNKSKRFNERKLEEISTLAKCPTLEFSDYDLLRQIDVLWFKESGRNLVPEYAFEVELSTNIWSGLGRMSTLKDYPVNCYIISNDKKKYEQKIHSYWEYKNKFKFIQDDLIGALYASEINVIELRHKIGL